MPPLPLPRAKGVDNNNNHKTSPAEKAKLQKETRKVPVPIRSPILHSKVQSPAREKEVEVKPKFQRSPVKNNGIGNVSRPLATPMPTRTGLVSNNINVSTKRQEQSQTKGQGQGHCKCQAQRSYQKIHFDRQSSSILNASIKNTSINKVENSTSEKPPPESEVKPTEITSSQAPCIPKEDPIAMTNSNTVEATPAPKIKPRRPATVTTIPRPAPRVHVQDESGSRQPRPNSNLNARIIPKPSTKNLGQGDTDKIPTFVVDSRRNPQRGPKEVFSIEQGAAAQITSFVNAQAQALKTTNQNRPPRSRRAPGLKEVKSIPSVETKTSNQEADLNDACVVSEQESTHVVLAQISPIPSSVDSEIESFVSQVILTSNQEMTEKEIPNVDKVEQLRVFQNFTEHAQELVNLAKEAALGIEVAEEADADLESKLSSPSLRDYNNQARLGRSARTLFDGIAVDSSEDIQGNGRNDEDFFVKSCFHMDFEMNRYLPRTNLKYYSESHDTRVTTRVIRRLIRSTRKQCGRLCDILEAFDEKLTKPIQERLHALLQGALVYRIGEKVQGCLKITNLHTSPVCFRIFASAPRILKLEPVNGVLEPGCMTMIQVTIECLAEEPIIMKTHLTIESFAVLKMAEIKDVERIFDKINKQEIQTEHANLTLFLQDADEEIAEEEMVSYIVTPGLRFFSTGKKRMSTLAQDGQNELNLNSENVENSKCFESNLEILKFLLSSAGINVDGCENDAHAQEFYDDTKDSLIVKFASSKSRREAQLVAGTNKCMMKKRSNIGSMCYILNLCTLATGIFFLLQKCCQS